jgi:hypothetical protein
VLANYHPPALQIWLKKGALSIPKTLPWLPPIAYSVQTNLSSQELEKFSVDILLPYGCPQFLKPKNPNCEWRVPGYKKCLGMDTRQGAGQMPFDGHMEISFCPTHGNLPSSAVITPFHREGNRDPERVGRLSIIPQCICDGLAI